MTVESDEVIFESEGHRCTYSRNGDELVPWVKYFLKIINNKLQIEVHGTNNGADFSGAAALPPQDDV